jgi:hypothetical protein
MHTEFLTPLPSVLFMPLQLTEATGKEGLCLAEELATGCPITLISKLHLQSLYCFILFYLLLETGSCYGAQTRLQLLDSDSPFASAFQVARTVNLGQASFLLFFTIFKTNVVQSLQQGYILFLVYPSSLLKIT